MGFVCYRKIFYVLVYVFRIYRMIFKDKKKFIGEIICNELELERVGRLW